MKFLFIALGLMIFTDLSYAKNSDLTRLHHTIAFLTSDTLKGRLTGAPGERLAEVYAAQQFQRMGLQPAGDNGTYFQTFEFSSGTFLGKNNFLTLNHTPLRLNQDWRPVFFSKNGAFKQHTIIFAGYGITAPNYDSYKHLNVKNKWVLVFRYLPEKINESKRHLLNPYSSLRYKAFLAQKKGALGIIFVSGPNAKVKNQLVPTSLDTSLVDAGILAISITNTSAQKILGTKISLKQLQNRLDSGKLTPSFHLTTNIKGHIDLQKQKKQGHNVVAQLKINDKTAPILIIGAHIDHLGQGEYNASSHLIHHGADDNASGVACVLETAEQISALHAQGKWHGHKNIIFALWSGEELGLLGSTHFLKKLTIKKNTLDAYINLDMVGRLKKKLLLQGINSSPNWPTLITDSKQTLSIIPQYDSYLPTDSTAFYLRGIPALNFFTGSHTDYHTPNDTLDKINWLGLQQITHFLVNIVATWEMKPTMLVYQQTNPHPHVARGFRVYLGTIPDYTSTDRLGVKLAGVSKGSPSEKAGLKPNDVIVALDGKTIRDIYDYTFVLNALHAHQAASLVLKRGQQRLTLKIVPQSRD